MRVHSGFWNKVFIWISCTVANAWNSMNRANAVATFLEIAKACRGLSLGSFKLVEAAKDDPKAVGYKIEIDVTYGFNIIDELSQVAKKHGLDLLVKDHEAIIYEAKR